MVKMSVELQRIVQKVDKLEKMINPNSKKSLILWEEDDSFKSLINDIKEYAKKCNTYEFPVELLDKLRALYNDSISQVTEGTVKVDELKKQAKVNMNLSQRLSEAYISAMARNTLEEYNCLFEIEDMSFMKDYLEIIRNSIPESEEYVKAEKAVKSKISNLENSVHITIDLERNISKTGALEYIKTEIEPAIKRLQAVHDEIFNKEEEDIITALTVRRTFAERVYDAIVRPFTNLFKKKNRSM